MVSAEGASENFRVFCRTAKYDVIFSNSRGRASAPPPAGAHAYRSMQHITQNDSPRRACSACHRTTQKSMQRIPQNDSP